MKKLLASAVLLLSSVCFAQTHIGGVVVQDLVTVTFSATPTFDARNGNVFKLTLTGNVTSSTLTHADAGQQLSFEICQDGTGGRTFVPPTNVQGWVAISSTASACTTEAFLFDGANAQPLASFNTLSPMTTLGDVTYESAANTASRLAGNTTTTKKYLSQTGTGTVSAAPSWQQIAAADLSDGNTGTGSIVHTTSPALASPTTTGTDSGTETLGNKTLSGTTPYNRLAATQGTALASADFSFSAGWGTGATIGSIRGTDSAFTFTMTAGTSPTTDPTVTLTFHDGAWAHAPICSAGRLRTGSVELPWSVSTTTTTAIFQARAGAEGSSPLNAVPYGANVVCVASPN